MNHLEILLSVSSLAFQIALCGFVIIRQAHRVVPLFSSFAFIVLAWSICIALSSLIFGFESTPTYLGSWAGIFFFVAARSLAIAELCRFELSDYRGIWALVWRVLVVLGILLTIHAAMDSWGQPNGVAIYWTTFSRDFALASIVVLAVLFVFRNYYDLPLEPLPRLIAIGICLTCVVDAVGNAIVLNSFKGYLFPWFLESQKALWPAMEPLVRRVDDIWSSVHLLAFMISMGIWCYALRKPLPEPRESPELLPARIYREMSPAINMRLATVNSRLVELLKP